MAKKELKTKENPKLCQREIAGGKISLYLEYYKGRTYTQKFDAEGKPMYYPEFDEKGKPKNGWNSYDDSQA